MLRKNLLVVRMLRMKGYLKPLNKSLYSQFTVVGGQNGGCIETITRKNGVVRYRVSESFKSKKCGVFTGFLRRIIGRKILDNKQIVLRISKHYVDVIGKDDLIKICQKKES